MKKKIASLSHVWRGFVPSVASVVLVGLLLFPALSELASRPSAGLLRSMGQLGGALLIAWSVQATVAVRASRHRSAVWESIVGSLVGSTSCGFLGVVLVLGLAERAEAGHWIWADRLAFAVATGALLFLGVSLSVLVYLTYEWSRQDRIDPLE